MRVSLNLSRSSTIFALCCALTPLAAQDRGLPERFPTSKAAPRLAVVMDSLPRGTRDRLLSLIDSAAMESLPTEPLFLRTLEGKVKGASDTRIIAAISQLRTSMKQAQQLLGPKATTQDIAVAADVLQAGVSEDRLVQMRSLRGKQTMTAPLNAWLNLIARGAGPDQAWDHINEMVKQKAVDSEFGRLTPADISRLNKGRP